MLLQSCSNTFPCCFAPSLREQIWLIADVNMTDVNSDKWLIPMLSPWVHVSSPYSPAFFFAPYNPSPAPFICHFSTNISLWCAPLPHSIAGVQFCRPRGSDFSCGNKRGRPEGGSAHRFWDPAAGGCLCHRNPFRSPSHPLYRARQPSWEVTGWDT